jgi:uncharacterized protein YrrD
VEALLIDEGGWFNDALVVKTDGINSIGEDAIMVKDESYYQEAKQVSRQLSQIAKKGNFLSSTNILTETGEEMGKVTDILFEIPSGRVHKMEVSQGTLADTAHGRYLVPIADILLVGKDATIVKESDWREIEANQEGGVVEALERGQDELQQAWQELKQEAEETFGKVKEETAEVADAASTKVRSGLARTKRQARDLSEDPEVQAYIEKARGRLRELQKQGEDVVENIEERAHLARNQAQNKVDEYRQERPWEQAHVGVKHGVSRLGDAADTVAGEWLKPEEVVGQYLTKNVLDKKDAMIGKRGEMITHSMLQKAKKSGVMEQVTSYASVEPMRS